MFIISYTTMKLNTSVILYDEVRYVVDLTFFKLVVKEVTKFCIYKCVNARTLHNKIISRQRIIHTCKYMQSTLDMRNLTESSTRIMFMPRNSLVSRVTPLHIACALTLIFHLILEPLRVVIGS